MTARIRIAAGAAACAVLAGAGAALLLGGRDVPATPADSIARPAGVRVACEQQSIAGVPGTSGFPAAFTSRRNLVVGPLSLVDGGTLTDAVTVREFGGNKFPVLVKAGHRVTVSVPASHRAIAGLDYGFQPVPQHTLAFASCSERQAASRAGGPVTFWSGFVTTTVPACVPLDVWVDDAPRRRVAIPLGRDCSRGSGPAPLPPLRDCATRSEGGRPETGRARPGDAVLGPLRLVGLRRLADRRALAMFGRAGDLDGSSGGRRTYRDYVVKSGVLVPAGVSATLSIGAAARGWAALTFRGRESAPAIRFEACGATERAFSYDGIVGSVTAFGFAFIVARPGCVPLEVAIAGRPTVRTRVSFGAGRCSPARQPSEQLRDGPAPHGP